MKKLLIYLLPAVLFFSSCSQNSSTPNNANVCTINNNLFASLSFNGKTLTAKASELYGQKYGVRGSFTLTDTSYTTFWLYADPTCPSLDNQGNTLAGLSLMCQKSGGPTTGQYTTTVLPASFQELGSTIKVYYIKDSSVVMNITSITTSEVAGTFTGIVKDITNEYPFTGSFKAARAN